VFARMIGVAKSVNTSCSITIAASWGCPFEGEVPIERVVHVARRAVELGASEIGLADTIGVADPWEVKRRISAVRDAIGNIPLRCHFHSTRNTGIANSFAAIEAGVRILDSSTGGIGGCPFAPRATGNIATEDLLYMLDRAGIHTGICIEKVIETTKWLENVLDHSVPAMVSKAGLFPQPRSVLSPTGS